MSAPRQRSTSRKRKKPSSTLQVDLEHAIQLPRGIQRTLDLVQAASKSDIDALKNTDYGPLAATILLAGTTYTRRVGSRIPATLMPTLVRLVKLCSERGISVDGGSVLGEQFQRPLVLAAYYGFKEIVELLLDLGATPDLADGEGRTVWHAALQNPSGQYNNLRDCDKEIAQLLVQRGLVTASLSEWRGASPKGSMVYINGDAVNGSALLAAIRNGNTNAIGFLVQNGAALTDRDFLALNQRLGGLSLLHHDALAFVRPLAATAKQIKRDFRYHGCWSPETDWSFPPAWKVAIRLTHHCGLPRDVFEDHVQPFLARDWFYTPEQLQGDLPPLLGASKGQERYNMNARGARWM